MYQDHRGVVGTAGPVADRQQTLAELLDREILPCLERPGRLLGPFDLPSATVTGTTKLALVWPALAEGAHTPAELRPLLVGLPDPRPFSLSLGSVPSPNLRAALRAHGQPVFGRPDWEPLPAADLWLVHLDHPLQLTGLLTILDASGLAPRALDRRGAPRLVITGPGAARVAELARVYANFVLPGTIALDADAWNVFADAARSGGDGVVGLAGLGPVLGPVGAPPVPAPERAALADPGSRPAGPVPRPDFCVGPEFLEREAWREAGRGRAWTDHVVVGAGSERLRLACGLASTDRLTARIERSLSEEAASLGLHFVIGLPGETEADRLAIADFVNDVVAAAPRGVRQVAVYIREFLAPDAPLPALEDFSTEREARIARIHRRIRPRRVRVEAAPSGLALFEAVLASGPGAAPVLEALWGNGAWCAHADASFGMENWRRALVRAGFPAGSAANGSADPVSSAVAETGLPSRLAVQVPLSVSPDAPRRRNARAKRVRPGRWTRWRSLVPQRFEYRIEYAKEGRLRFLGPAELSELLLGACDRARIPVCTSGVVQPRPRVGYGPSLGAGIAGDHEVLDLSLERKVDDLADRLRTELPEGIRLRAVEFMPRCSPSMQLSRVARAEYEARVDAEVHTVTALREEDIARVRRWSRRIEEGLPPEGEDPADPIRQLCAIHWEKSPDGPARLGFTLDLRAEGARCRPREVVARVLTGISVDPRLIPLRRLRLLVVDDSSGRARLRTPLEQVLLARRRQRALERTWAE